MQICPFPTVQPFLNFTTQVIQHPAKCTEIIFMTVHRIKFDFFQQADKEGPIIFNINIIPKVTGEVLDELNDFIVIRWGHAVNYSIRR